MHISNTNSQWYNLVECGKEFMQRASLYHHMDSVYGMKKRHVCVVCERAYTHATNLRLHMISHHR